MRELQLIRRIELASIAVAAVIIVALRLYMEIMHHNSMLAMDQNGHFANLPSYNLLLNSVFPVVARVILLLEAWYVFHYLVYPKIKAGNFKEKEVWYLAIVIICTAAGIFLYHFQKIYLEYHISHNIITSIRTNSLYRKMTVFTDTVGMLVIFGIYEGLTQVYYYLHQQLIRVKELAFRLLSYFILASLAAFLIILAIFTPFPDKLWDFSHLFSELLLMGGLGIQVYALQQYLYQHVIPSIQTQDFSKFIIHLLIATVLVLTGTIIIWGCYSKFRWVFIEPVAVMSVLSLLSAGIVAYVRYILSREKAILQTQVSATSAELLSLRSQINPHFLFNALNSLYATALKEKSDKTADGIQKLGDMMRFMLEENNQDRIPLDKEVEYLHNYIEIQRLRIDESQGVEIRVNIQQPDREVYIAPMMLNPFVENAFKHGISLQHPSWIYITLTLDATRLYFKVHNSFHPRKDNDPEEENSGVGLSNVKKRLQLIYPNRHTLDIQQSDKDYFVSLTLAYW